MGIFGWQDYSAVKQSQVMRKVLETDLPPSLSRGPRVNGLTAFRPVGFAGQAGKTVAVSTAAGGVGSASADRKDQLCARSGSLADPGEGSAVYRFRL
jgi:NADPH-dependent curcumin reductase CurA